MATWPSGTKASTANVDEGTDSPATARADLKQGIDNQNSIIDMFLISDPQNNDFLKYNSTNSRFELTSVTEATGAELENVIEDTTPQLGGDLDVNGFDIISTDNGDITLRANGGGIIEAISDGFIIGDGVSEASLTTNGATNIVIDTNDGVDTGSITIATGANGDISLSPDGTGLVIVDSDLDITNGNIITGTEDGDITLTPNGTGRVIISGDLQVDGSTITVNSTVVTVDDPVFTLGGDTAPTTDDNKDRGIEFRWHDGSTAKLGFFGYDDSTGYFTFIPDASNTSEVFSGTQGDIQATNFRGTHIGAVSTDAVTGITTNGNITITPDGTGDVLLSADTVQIGDSNANATVTTNGTGDLILNTNGGSNSGSITIADGADGDITVTPNGTGKTIVSRLNYNEGIYEIGTGQSGTITPDAANGNLQYIEISGNITINALNNPVAGQAVTIVIDSLGAYTLTSSMLFAGGDKTLTDTGVDILSIVFLGDGVYLASLNKDFS